MTAFEIQCTGEGVDLKLMIIPCVDVADLCKFLDKNVLQAVGCIGLDSNARTGWERNITIISI